MTARSLFIAGALTISSIGVLSAKTFDIILHAPSMAGTTELKPGEYKLQVEGSQATFKQVDGDRKSFAVPVKIESASTKFSATTVETSSQNGMDNIHAIDLGGSTTKLEFGR